MMAAIGAVVGAGSSAPDAITQYKEGQLERKLLKRQAYYTQWQNEQETIYATEVKEEETRRANMELDAIIGTQKARLAAQGVKISEGSPADVFAGTRGEGEREISYAAHMRQEEIDYKKQLAAFQVFETMKASKIAALKGQVGAWGTVVKGAVSGAMMGMGASGGGGGSAGLEGMSTKSPVTGSYSVMSGGGGWGSVGGMGGVSSSSMWNFFGGYR